QEEIEEYYEKFPNEFTQDESVHARHIFLKVPADATKEVVEGIEEKGRRILRQIEDGVDFGVMAKSFSEDLA
ncbi:MAG: peptidyl-prolyl cis-trans isomerase, partial [Candidatus Latescibacteria bacterium]|nr:peptidyl-prolyl cis-trans isomerase [Candidatus Latescibacterota bacterium]